MSDNYSARKEKTFFGHPIQLSTLFHIELWERFSFYGMQGILLIYLYYTADKGGLGMDKSLAGGIVGAYGGSVYLSTILGAWLADRIWGAEKTLFISGIIADEAAIGMINSKTTAVRIIPVTGKTVGDSVEFGGLLGYAPVMPVKEGSCEVFVNRGGRIPAPVQSMKN